MTTVIECRPPAAAQPTPQVAPDFTTIKQRQQATWSAGDYAVIGTTLQIVASASARLWICAQVSASWT